MLKQAILLGCCIISLTIQAQQQYIGTDYTLKNGLPVESIKWIEQDTSGFIWLATDDGLIRFDGTRFKHYSRNTKPFATGYFKTIFRRKNGQMLVAAYLGVYEIINKPDTTYFRSFPDSASNAQGLDEVKNIYETSDGVIWFAEQNSISCWRNNVMKKYEFDNKNFTSDYFRSFQLLETAAGDFYVVSYKGWIYYYDKNADRFVEIGKIEKNKDVVISSACVVNNRIFVARNGNEQEGGIYELVIQNQTSVQSVLRTNMAAISYLLPDKSRNSVFVSFWLGGIVEYNIANNNIQLLTGFGKIKTYQLSRLSDGVLCVATEKGLLIRNAVFFIAPYEQLINRSVTSISSDEQNNVFFASENMLIKNTLSNYTIEKTDLSSTYLRLALKDSVIWVTKKIWGNIVPTIERISKHKIDTIRLEHAKGDAFFIEPSTDGSVWMCQDMLDSLIRLMPDGSFRYYGKKQGVYSKCIVIRQDKKTGRIVAGGLSDTSYLFQYNPKTDRFDNISKPFNKNAANTIDVSDLAFDSKGRIYLAAQGVLRIDTDSARWVSGRYSSYLFNSIAIDTLDNIYAGAGDIYKITPHEITKYNTDDGLLANPSYRNLHVDKKNRLWVGSVAGLNMAELTPAITTPQPYLVGMETEGLMSIKNFTNIPLTAGNYLLLQVSNLAFPHEAVLFEYRIIQKQNDWQPCTKRDEIFIPELEAGQLTIEIRALKQGNFGYSLTKSYSFNVLRPWYLRWWGIMLFVFLISLFVYIIVVFNTQRLLRQKHRLEQTVKERTADLEKNRNEIEQQREQIARSYNELQSKNDELNKAYENMQEANTLIVEKNGLLAKQAYELQTTNIALEKEKMEVVKQKTELENTLHTLQKTQKKLVEAEKMASLGNLVAGVAHEINTPVGVAITSISTVINDIKELVAKYEKGDMSASDFESYVQMFYDGNALALKNLERTAQLVRSFKQISLDQHSEQERKFNLNDYLHDILASINPEFKHTQIKIAIDCPPDLVINSYPGAFAQIFTNLLTNSKRHGFRNRNDGQINIVVKRENDKLHITYTDNGHGISEKVLPRIFDPFFTTDMQGGTGLGLNILYNLVTQKLGGEIKCESREGEGVKFLMTL